MDTKIGDSLIEKTLKQRRKRNVIITCVLLIITLVFFIFGQIVVHSAKAHVQDMSSLLMSDSTNKADKYAHATLQGSVYSFASNKKNEKIYCFGFDKNGYAYVLCMSEDDYNQYEDNDENAVIEIEGFTKTPDSDIQSLAISGYTKMTGQFITSDDYDSYFGEVYLDSTDSGFSIAFISYIIAIFAGVFLCIKIYDLVAQYLSEQNVEKQFTEAELEKINSEIEQESTSTFNSNDILYLTDHYIVSIGTKFHIIRFEDAIWTYVLKRKKNIFITINQSLILRTKKHKYSIFTTPPLGKKDAGIYDAIASEILKRNGNVIVGYTVANEKAYKEICKSQPSND